MNVNAPFLENRKYFDFIQLYLCRLQASSVLYCCLNLWC